MEPVESVEHRQTTSQTFPPNCGLAPTLVLQTRTIPSISHQSPGPCSTFLWPTSRPPSSQSSWSVVMPAHLHLRTTAVNILYFPSATLSRPSSSSCVLPGVSRTSGTFLHLRQLVILTKSYQSHDLTVHSTRSSESLPQRHYPFFGSHHT